MKGFSKKRKNNTKYLYKAWLLQQFNYYKGMMKRKKETEIERELSDTGMVEIDFLSIFKEAIVK